MNVKKVNVNMSVRPDHASSEVIATWNMNKHEKGSIVWDTTLNKSKYWNGTEWVADSTPEEVNERVKDSIQGYVGVITDYYKFDGSNSTQQLLANEWTKLETSENVIFNHPLTSQEGIDLWNSSTDTYSLAGLDDGSFASIRVLCRVNPEVDESSASIRLNFQTNAATQAELPSFQVESQLFNMTQGADIWYSDEENISFFVANSLSGSTIAEAGSVTIEIKSSVDAQVEVLAYTLYMNK